MRQWVSAQQKPRKGRVITSCPGGVGPTLFFFSLINLLIYLFLAVLGLRCCALWLCALRCFVTFSSCSEGGLLCVVVRGLLIVVASLVGEHGL